MAPSDFVPKSSGTSTPPKTCPMLAAAPNNAPARIICQACVAYTKINRHTIYTLYCMGRNGAVENQAQTWNKYEIERIPALVNPRSKPPNNETPSPTAA